MKVDKSNVDQEDGDLQEQKTVPISESVSDERAPILLRKGTKVGGITVKKGDDEFVVMVEVEASDRWNSKDDLTLSSVTSKDQLNDSDGKAGTASLSDEDILTCDTPDELGDVRGFLRLELVSKTVMRRQRRLLLILS